MPGGWEWLIIIAVLLLLFGAKKLPEMARSIGQSARVFKGEMKGLREDEKTPETTAKTAETPPPAALPATPPVTPAPTPAPAPDPAAQEQQSRSGQ